MGQADTDEKPLPDSRAPGSPVRIVLADDSPDMRAMLRIMLRLRRGLEVVGEASDGLEALRLVHECAPDAVLLDIAMPNMDGLEVATRLRAVAPEVKIIMLSAYSEKKMAGAALEAGADAYVEKSASHDVLFAHIARLFPAAGSLDVPAETFAADEPIGPTEETLGERRYRGLLDALEEGVLMVNERGDVAAANFAATQILGRPTSRLLGSPTRELGLEDGGAIARTLSTGRPQSHVQTALRCPDGGQRWLLLSCRALSGGMAETREVLVSFADVTDLKASEAVLERLFSDLHVLIAYLDSDLNLIRVNRAYAVADGRPEEFFIGQNHFAVYPSEENEAIFREVVRSGRPYVAFEKPFEYPDAPERGVTYWDWTLHPVVGPGGNVERLILTLIDATERRRLRDTAARKG